jgi:hypothetical protein
MCFEYLQRRERIGIRYIKGEENGYQNTKGKKERYAAGVLILFVSSMLLLLSQMSL